MEPQKSKVVVVDDDPIVLRAVGEILRRDGYEVTALQDPTEALAIVKDTTIDVVVSDIKMPHLSGLELLRAFKDAQPDVEVIIMTGHATVETAVEAVKAGAYDYLTKPFERIENFSLAVQKAVERRTLKKRALALEQALDHRAEFEGIVGQSAQMRAVFKTVETVGPTMATVLIQGESGTGKELVARAIHDRSPRRDRPYVAVNCSALSETLLDSELFGHVKGAFTGALGNKKGLFEAAHGGTIFLDEIGDVPPATQVRLLRVLQEGKVKRVGANEEISVDTRVIAATNVDLAKAKAEGRFREDLYYRLNVIQLSLPPLRDRADDVPLLAHHFARRYAERMGKKLEGFTVEAMSALTLHTWPGNVRELENAIERAVVMTAGPKIDIADLPREVTETKGPARTQVDLTSLVHLPFAQAKALTIRAFEARYLTTLLERTGGNITQAALAAGMDRSNFRRLLKEHGLAGRGHNDPEPA
ncbi:MAG: sigma-54-dependent Fis family transcriptional regulator [Myxococcaceae bacterium]|nr:sigma-54-dependent Fis family transcriptional regulator [Myxococcaceae bacterium]